METKNTDYSIFGEFPVTNYYHLNLKLSPNYNYCIVPVLGNCMNSSQSPIQIKNGDKILMHTIPLIDIEIASIIGKVICLILKNGIRIVKQAIFYDGIQNGIIVRLFQPYKKDFFINISMIKTIFVVDRVIENCYNSYIEGDNKR